MDPTSGEVQFCRTAEPALFETVDRVHSGHQAFCGAESNLYEYEAVCIQHDEVDLAQAAAIVAFDRAQSPTLEVT